MTTRTDLTLNNDFAKDSIVINLVDVADNEIMTNDEWEVIEKHESIFGKRHRTQKSEIFCKKLIACTSVFPWRNSLPAYNNSSQVDYKMPWRNVSNSVRRLDLRESGLFDLR